MVTLMVTLKLNSRGPSNFLIVIDF